MIAAFTFTALLLALDVYILLSATGAIKDDNKKFWCSKKARKAVVSKISS